MFTISFNYHGKKVYTGKSHVWLCHYQTSVKKAKVYDSIEVVNTVVSQLTNFLPAAITDIKVNAL